MAWTEKVLQGGAVDLGIYGDGTGHGADVNARKKRRDTSLSPRRPGRQCLLLQHEGAGPHGTLAIDDAERDVVSVEPFVVVDGGPVEHATDVDATPDRFVDDGQAASEVGSPNLVVIGADPVLSHEERH